MPEIQFKNAPLQLGPSDWAHGTYVCLSDETHSPQGCKLVEMHCPWVLADGHIQMCFCVDFTSVSGQSCNPVLQLLNP